MFEETLEGWITRNSQRQKILWYRSNFHGNPESPCASYLFVIFSLPSSKNFSHRKGFAHGLILKVSVLDLGNGLQVLVTALHTSFDTRARHQDKCSSFHRISPLLSCPAARTLGDGNHCIGYLRLWLLQLDPQRIGNDSLHKHDTCLKYTEHPYNMKEGANIKPVATIDMLVTLWHGMVCHTMTSRGMSHSDIAWYVTLWHRMVCHTMTSHGMSHYDIAWYVTLWHRMACHTTEAPVLCYQQTLHVHYHTLNTRILLEDYLCPRKLY